MNAPEAASETRPVHHGERPAPATPCPPAIRARLRRIEGQVRGLARMIEAEAPCDEVLTQFGATARALDGLALSLLERHLSRSFGPRGTLPPEDRPAAVTEVIAAVALLRHHTRAPTSVVNDGPTHASSSTARGIPYPGIV